MDATARIVAGAAVALLAAIGASFRSLRGKMRHLHAQMARPLRFDPAWKASVTAVGLRRPVGVRQRRNSSR